MFTKKFSPFAVLDKKETAQKLGKSKPTRCLNDLVRKIVDAGLIEYTIQNKPNSHLQKYRLTAKGRAMLTSL